jgi:hypothetical protein
LTFLPTLFLKFITKKRQKVISFKPYSCQFCK